MPRQPQAFTYPAPPCPRSPARPTQTQCTIIPHSAIQSACERRNVVLTLPDAHSAWMKTLPDVHPPMHICQLPICLQFKLRQKNLSGHKQHIVNCPHLETVSNDIIATVFNQLFPILTRRLRVNRVGLPTTTSEIIAQGNNCYIRVVKQPQRTSNPGSKAAAQRHVWPEAAVVCTKFEVLA